MMKTLSDKEWADCQLDSFAIVNSGKDIYAQERVVGNTPYITSGTTNNGIGYFVANDNNSKAKNAISVNRNGAVGEAFYHPYTALYGNDCRRVNIKAANDEATQLFIARCISSQKEAFSYSRKLGTARLKKLHVMLPVTDDGEPDYDYMSDYVQEHKEAMLAKYRDYAEKRIIDIGDDVDVPALDEKEWGEFIIGEVFKVSGTVTTKPNEIILKGETPRVTCAATRNGLDDCYQNIATESKGVLTVDSATIGAVFYQPYDFIATDHVEKIAFEEMPMTVALGLFLQTAIKDATGAKYQYGYKFSQKRIKRQKNMLPINDSGEPDFEYMEQYVKNMMLRKYKQYLAFLDTQEILKK